MLLVLCDSVLPAAIAWSGYLRLSRWFPHQVRLPLEFKRKVISESTVI